MSGFLRDLVKTIVKTFSGKNIYAHFLAFALSAIIVLSGFDWYYFTHMRNVGASYWFFPAVILGAIIPIIIPIYLFASSSVLKSHARKVLGTAITVSIVAGWVISSFYKSLTGRIQPPHSDLLTDISHQWNFGFMKHGFFWGWPSSHTTIAFAMAFTLIALFPKNKLLTFFAFIYALYIGLGVSMSIHWFSEFVAGAIIGAVIGITVGKLYKNKVQY